MRHFFTLIALLLAVGLAHAQEFSHPYSKGQQPVLSQPLEWVSASASAAAGLPEDFAVRPEAWAFAPYAATTVLPTSTGRDVWLQFTLAASATPQSWVVRIPRITVQKVGLYDPATNTFKPTQLAGSAVAHSAWSRATRTPSFEVLSTNVDKTYYMRLEHSSAITERPELMSQANFADGAARFGTLYGVMLGSFGILTLACLATYGIVRKTVFLSLAAFAATGLLHYLVAMGMASWRLWPNSVYLTQAMQWAAPLFALAAGCWFFAQASRARDISKTTYRALQLVALTSLVLALVTLVSTDFLPRDFLNAWALVVLLVMPLLLVWLSLRGMRGNLWLLAGLLPIAASGASGLAYNYGWVTHFESARVAGVFLTQLGLAWLFVALLWRHRSSLLSSSLGTAMNDSDPITGLLRSPIAVRRLPRVLQRSARLKLGCGVIMLNWRDHQQLMTALRRAEQYDLLKQMGLILSRVARDIDIASHLEDSYFIVIVEGPVSKSTLASLATQILTACLRVSNKAGELSPFKVHLAIWHGQPENAKMSVDQVISALKTRLKQMSPGTSRPVQFVDTSPGDNGTDSISDNPGHRGNLLAKIDAIEASTSVRAMLAPEQSKK